MWLDALANYISGAGYASDAHAFEAPWKAANRIRHVIGKGVSRLHAVYWSTLPLSAGLRLLDEILVRGYVTVDGEKISKSIGNAISPDRAVDDLGLDALLYFLLPPLLVVTVAVILAGPGCVRPASANWLVIPEILFQEHRCVQSLH